MRLIHLVTLALLTVLGPTPAADPALAQPPAEEPKAAVPVDPAAKRKNQRIFRDDLFPIFSHARCTNCHGRVNLVTGDYSRGAVGFWIENGELAYPVEEITIASNLRQMLLAIEAVGNDLEFRSRVVSPTVKVGRMTIAGI